MKVVGILLALSGWLIPVAGLSLTASNSARLILCLFGAGLCVTGILGCLNRAHAKEAVWKK